jgi:putative sigma-54 modulation protein
MARPQISPDESYNVSIIGRHIEVTEPIRQYVLEKLHKIERVAEEIVDVHVRLEVQGLQQSCSIVMQFYKHLHIKVAASADTLYAAIDKCTDKVMNLIRKHKKKIQSHHAKKYTMVQASVNVVQPHREDELQEINRAIKEENEREKKDRFELHKVVSKESVPLRMLTQDEAVWRMEICDDPFLIYRSEEDQKFKIIQRREDGNYSIIQVQ